VKKVSKSAVFSWLCALGATGVVLVSPAGAALAPPTPLTPGDGVTVDSVPAFGWQAVARADRYEWEISADPGFNSPVLGSSYDHFFTKNTRATLKKVIPNGTYWWHVRAVAADGSVSPWSPGHSFVKGWARSPDLTFPEDGATFVYPRDHFRLAWEPVAGAWHYLVTVATDPGLSSIVWSTGAPVETQATAFTLASPLAPDQTYYWGVTPIDGAGNRGSPSAVRSFSWEWPSETTGHVEDVASEPEIYDYEFSWDPVPGAAGYELEVNSSSDFAPGSKVCCAINTTTKVTTIGTSYSPTLALPNNRYYWRVRPLDSSRNAGQWSEGPEFIKGFDDVEPKSIQNLRMLDNPSPTQGPFPTHVPIVAWDPVPGASSYEVEVTRYVEGCQWTATAEHWRSTTSTTAWTPLGWGWNNVKPYSSGVPVSVDSPSMIAGHDYCVRVTALDRPADAVSPYVRSAEAYLPDEVTPAFTWLGPEDGGACSPSCNEGAMGSGDYLSPVGGVVTASMPLFRWKPLAGYQSYFVLVARDPEFTNLVDYAFTRVNAYAPRRSFGPKTYPDETTAYYWAVLPATGPSGSGVTTAPRFSAPQDFHKRSEPPELLAPDDATVFPGVARFQWRAAVGARRYRLQVSKDPTFASGILEDVLTDSTAFTSSKTYPADTNLYWRVRADAESSDVASGIGLRWSETRTFRKTLAGPILDPANPTSGDAIPTWMWEPLPGAVSYDFHLEFPNGTERDFFRIPSAAATPTLMQGTGIWHWRVRANFPRVDSLAVTPGPWTSRQSFTRTIKEPMNLEQDAGAGRVLLTWDPKMGARNYRLQVSTREDFSTSVDSATTDNTAYAPLLTTLAYQAGGTFYWRVAAADSVFGNVGDYSPAQTFTLPARSITKTSSSITASVSKTRTRIKVSGSVFPSHPGKIVSVTLYRKRSGAFRALSTKRPTLNSFSRYATSFSRPKRGRCKITARFGGDVDHRASAKTVFFRC
jgi:large repetitive protein